MNSPQKDSKSNTPQSLRKSLETIEKGISEVMGSDTPTGRVTVTAANWLTMIRIFIVPIFWIAFFGGELKYEIAATLLLAIGAITDAWDGRIARRRGQVTPFGAFMDPLADKLLILSAFWSILIHEEFGELFIWALLIICIISIREVGLTLLRVKAFGGGPSIVTSVWGKWKTGVQLTALLSIMVAINVRGILDLLEIEFAILHGHSFIIGVNLLLLTSMVTSLVSGWFYIKGPVKKETISVKK